ncbi:MAG: DnaJ domain-containing protein [Acaryochloridaceae cyanobacterium CSU_3_4]|nr:DnaJ domain-containing protein [Acaryochloridaceae cyanobacterium CSU_3_4]
MADPQDHYNVLQLSQQATPTDIKKAFRRLARQYHPDLNPHSPTAAEAFQKICQAYAVLNHQQQPHQQQELDNPYYLPESPLVEEPGSVVIQDAQHYFMQGVRKTNQRNFASAIAAFSQALHLDKSYLEAYMGRCQARFALGHHREVLLDCDAILRLQSDSAQAFFFRGRSCYRLGHLESAIASYSQAIALEPEYAQAHYHRGIAYTKVKERHALRDLQMAVRLFQQQGHIGHAQRTLSILKELNHKPLHRILNLPKNGFALIAHALGALPRLLVNPGGATLHLWRSQLPYQTLGISLILAGLSVGGVIGRVHFFAPSALAVSPGHLVILSSTALASLVLTSTLLRKMVGKAGSWSGDCLIVGAAVLPVGLWAILSGLIIQLGRLEFIALSLFAASYTILSLYSGYTKIGQISEPIAALAVPTLLMISYGMTAFIYKVLMLQLV